jgi:regulator of sigma E protease
VIEAKTVVAQTDRFWYYRGLNFQSVDQIQTADSIGMALSLGLREGVRRLGNVGRFLGMLVTGKVQAKFLGGPIRIAQMASYEAERGISAQLLFLTMLSMNLAILNFLPIPALDGGHMVFLIAEAIKGKRIDEALEMRLTFAGVLALLALMIFVFANDILHL